MGESLHSLATLPDDSVDAVICDPPYSSGGFTRSDRAQDPAQKYCQSGETCGRGSFSGDNRDQRGWSYWCALWLTQCLRIVKPSGYLLMFTDWRQLPAATDAIQAGGFVWRGIIAWDKGRGARAPHKGYFRHQCEYVVWGTKGPCDKAESGEGPFDGCFSAKVLQADKFHMTGKPTSLMVELSRIVPRGGVILDPFMGSGTTGVAALRTGRRFIGIEQDRGYFEIARRRLEEMEPRRRAA